MSIRRLTMLCPLAVLAVACDQVTTAPEEGGVHLEASTAPAVASVSGSGHVGFGSGLREFTFHAREHADGSAGGSYKIELTALELFFTVDVTCMATEGKTGWVGGIISDTNAGFIEIGSTSYFYAIDNGEGAGAPPDVVSTARINDVAGEDLLFCADRPLLLASFPIEQGNVQVR